MRRALPPASGGSTDAVARMRNRSPPACENRPRRGRARNERHRPFRVEVNGGLTFPGGRIRGTARVDHDKKGAALEQRANKSCHSILLPNPFEFGRKLLIARKRIDRTGERHGAPTTIRSRSDDGGTARPNNRLGCRDRAGSEGGHC